MTATQEIDVLAKQLCARHGDTSESEGGYRLFLPNQFPKLADAAVAIPRHDLEFKPFSDWSKGQTPEWWTANNKVKHQRHTHYSCASLKSALVAVGGLLLVNLYFYYDGLPPLLPGERHKDGVYPGPELYYPVGFVHSVTPTAIGMISNYKLP